MLLILNNNNNYNEDIDWIDFIFRNNFEHNRICSKRYKINDIFLKFSRRLKASLCNAIKIFIWMKIHYYGITRYWSCIFFSKFLNKSVLWVFRTVSVLINDEISIFDYDDYFLALLPFKRK